MLSRRIGQAARAGDGGGTSDDLWHIEDYWPRDMILTNSGTDVPGTKRPVHPLSSTISFHIL